MNPALLHRFKTIRPVRIHSLVHLSRSRRFASTIVNEITVDPAVLKRYDGSIVISGISGRFPSALNNKELTEKLLNGEELTSETSTRYASELLPARFGFLNCLDKFDANFFGLTPLQAHQTDPQIRLLLEATFEAMIDAGMNPTAMRGSRTAVFCGAYGGEAVDHNMLRIRQDNAGYLGVSSMNFMIPGRLAFAFDFQGPSSHMCTACSSSLTALEFAVQSMMLGKCDAAIVTGSCLQINPQRHFDLLALKALAMDGRCKTFDEAGDGFVRSEAAVAMLIQKEADAKRNYAKILNIRSRSDGFKHEGILFPNSKVQEKLLKESYAEVGIQPAQVSYLEVHGTGTPTGDPEELQALYNTFCKDQNRAKPLLIGSVKTNMGHTEAAAGLCSISKVIGVFQTGTIPKHLWFTKPRVEDQRFFDDSLKVVTEPKLFDGGIVGLSSIGIGGTNYHLILQPGPVHEKPPIHQQLPILIPFSGRSAAQVQESIKEAAQSAHNPEFAYLLHSSFRRDISGHSQRGFGLLKPGEDQSAITVQNCDSSLRPVWIIFPGMGSQWSEMGKDLMKIEPFAESLNRSRATLKNLNIDLNELLKAGNQGIFNDIRYAVVSITAIQMALYDTLMELGLVPDGFIGHSMGEFLCAYADGCFTAEETLLVTDARGRAFKESQKVLGGMASVGLSWEDVQERLPSDLELACHNAAQNVTVSGQAESVDAFVKELKKEGKFAAVVNSCGIAAHSKHVGDAADLLKKYVVDIIKGGRPRSSRWISTSIPEADWSGPLAEFASPEYFDNNLRAPVLFYDGLQHVPSSSLVVEVSPKGFFQALLQETLPNDCLHVAPMTVKAEDKLVHFFKSVGQIYTAGVDVEMDKLYPAVTTPVSSNTPSLAHLVHWDHGASWRTSVLTYPMDPGFDTDIDLELLKYAPFQGHKLENRIVLPGTAFLVMAWEQYALKAGLEVARTPVAFTNVNFRRATVLQESQETALFSEVACSTGKFYFRNQGDIVVTGTIERLPKETRFSPDIPQVPTSKYLPLNKADVYKEFRLRGCNYTGAHQGIQKIDNEGRWADIEWTGNWTTFLDSCLQVTILGVTARLLPVPVDIEKITVDPIEFLERLQDPLDGQEYPLVRVVFLPNQQKILAPGIEIAGVQAATIPRRGQQGNLAYETFKFCPFMEKCTKGMVPYIWEMVDLVLENNSSVSLRVVDVFVNKDNSMAKLFKEILTLKPMRESDVSMLTLVSEAEKLDDKDTQLTNLVKRETRDELVPDFLPDFVMLDDETLLKSSITSLKPAGFLLLQSEKAAAGNVPPPADAVLISQKSFPSKTISLYRKVTSQASSQVKRMLHIPVDSEGFVWMEALQEALKRPEEEAYRIYVTSQKNPTSGVLGFVNCLRKEDHGERIRCIFDPDAALQIQFHSPNKQLQTILNQDLVTTVLKSGQMGTYRHIPLEGEAREVVKNVEHAYLRPLLPGDLSSLSWLESPIVNYVQQPPLQPGKLPALKQYKVAYAAMNFRDVLLATGTIPLQQEFSYKGPHLGFEFSGFDEEGSRVMGMTTGNGLASSVVCDPRFVYKVPQDWTLEQAATVPIVYATVLYAIHTRGRVKPGQTVLIHAGSGGVGQAAISVALAHGCTVLTTVGTPEKREFIKKFYPQIKDEHIGNSRDTSFEAQFKEVTNGRGVDVVLNSLAGDKLHASLRCLAVNGKFLEIGVFDAFMNTPIGMRPFLKNIEFHGITLYNIMAEDMSNEAELREQLDDGIKNGAIRPLHSHVFEKDQAEDAFRFMATGKHTGKILIKVRDEANWEAPVNQPAIGQCYFASDKTYVIVGGLGGLGLELANWLVERGARHLVLTSRSGITTGYQSFCLRKWHEWGVAVDTPMLDLSDKQMAEAFLSELVTEHKIGGIFNSALVLKDEAFPNQTVQAFQEACAPKANVTQILDELTRKYCPDVDYFVVFSSAACGRGNADQTNYGWANAVMERICEKRKADGLHGLAIQWGVLGQVGMVAEKLLTSMDDTTELLGTLPQNVESCLEVLDAALQQNSPLVSSIIVAEKGSKKLDRASLIARMQKIFGIKDIASLSPDKKLSELGMDSLVGVELKQTLEREYDMTITKELLLSLTLADIKSMDNGTFDPARVGGALGSPSEPFELCKECLIKLNSGKDNMMPPLIIIHGVEGRADNFRPLASKLSVDVYGLQFTGKFDATSVKIIAKSYIKEIKEMEPNGPYNIAGYSGGATIAFEIVQQLRLGGDEVSTLILLDGCPSYVGTTDEVRKSFPRRLLESRNLYSKLSKEQREKLDQSVTGNVREDVQVLMSLAKELGDIKFDSKAVSQFVELVKAVADYEPEEQQYPGKLVLIQASESSAYSFVAPNEDYNVNKYCIGPVSRHKVAGDHCNFLEEDKVEETSGIITQLLQRTANVHS